MAIDVRPADENSGRIEEIAEILTAGLIRLAARKSSQNSAKSGEICLDISADESGHPTPTIRRLPND
jgi:hypothetical protein